METVDFEIPAVPRAEKTMHKAARSKDLPDQLVRDGFAHFLMKQSDEAEDIASDTAPQVETEQEPGDKGLALGLPDAAFFGTLFGRIEEKLQQNVQHRTDVITAARSPSDRLAGNVVDARALFGKAGQPAITAEVVAIADTVPTPAPMATVRSPSPPALTLETNLNVEAAPSLNEPSNAKTQSQNFPTKSAVSVEAVWTEASPGPTKPKPQDEVSSAKAEEDAFVESPRPMAAKETSPQKPMQNVPVREVQPDEPRRQAVETRGASQPLVAISIPPLANGGAQHVPSPAVQVLENIQRVLPASTPSIAAPAEFSRAVKFTLKPEGLGEVQVTLRLKGTEVALKILPDNTQAGNLLEAGREELKQKFQSAGMEIKVLDIAPLEPWREAFADRQVDRQFDRSRPEPVPSRQGQSGESTSGNSQHSRPNAQAYRPAESGDHEEFNVSTRAERTRSGSDGIYL
jgi:hypothetical protein